jgi:hypothetical protein
VTRRVHLSAHPSGDGAILFVPSLCRTCLRLDALRAHKRLASLRSPLPVPTYFEVARGTRPCPLLAMSFSVFRWVLCALPSSCSHCHRFVVGIEACATLRPVECSLCALLCSPCHHAVPSAVLDGMPLGLPSVFLVASCALLVVPVFSHGRLAPVASSFSPLGVIALRSATVLKQASAPPPYRVAFARSSPRFSRSIPLRSAEVFSERGGYWWCSSSRLGTMGRVLASPACGAVCKMRGRSALLYPRWGDSWYGGSGTEFDGSFQVRYRRMSKEKKRRSRLHDEALVRASSLGFFDEEQWVWVFASTYRSTSQGRPAFVSAPDGGVPDMLAPVATHR